MPHSLLFKAVVGIVSIIALVTAAMFLGIDSFVSVQFTELSRQRVLNQVSGMQGQLLSERQGLAALSELIASDSDLRQSAQYHLFLEGEMRPLEADVERIAATFRFDLFGVWDAGGSLVLFNDEGRVDVVEEIDVGAAQVARLIWHDGRLWAFATAPVFVNDLKLAWVGVARQVGTLGNEPGVLGEGLVTVDDSRGSSGIHAQLADLPVFTSEGEPVRLRLTVDDSVRDALDRTKQVVGLTLVGAAVLLMLSSILYLRRVLDPLRELTQLAIMLPQRLERGDLKPVRVRAGGEVAALSLAFNEMIQNLVRLRTLEAELRDQEKLTAIGRVAVRVAHDINNPLTVIKNTAHLLERSHQGDRQLERDLEMILHHCNRCSSIVDNLLRFGKPARLRYEEIEVNRCMEALLESLRQRRGSAFVSFQAHPRPLMIRGDRHQLEQMMDNLIDNALYANGGREVTVEVGMSDEGFVYFRITDFGKGFDSDDLARVFDFFYTTTAGGSGLGLPNARAIARAHGGDILITNPSIGEVTVRLPSMESARATTR